MATIFSQVKNESLLVSEFFKIQEAREIMKNLKVEKCKTACFMPWCTNIR